VFGVLRWRKRLDHIIGTFSSTPLKKVQPEILNILRMGTFQIVYLNRIPPSAAVNTSVELAKSLAPHWVVRYVNAVLRKLSRDHHSVRYPAVEKDPLKALSIRKSFPAWLIRRWLNRFDVHETALMCDAINSIPPVTLRANTLKISRDALLHKLKEQGEAVQETNHAPDSILLSGLQRPLFEMKTFLLGYFQVQDEAAQLISLFLNPQPGERILDACAGLGGKTGHIAQIMENKGVIIASDINNQKLCDLSNEMKRLGVSIVTTQQTDVVKNTAANSIGVFDRILLDAPCSGIGVLRRNPDAKWSRNEEMLTRYSRQQFELLDNIVSLVKPNGVLVYAVCSTESEENEVVINKFLSDHENFQLDKSSKLSMGSEENLFCHDGILKTFPHQHHMDGFFAARLRRK
jgi:16S rRNA (cytosine967-C5)-methyltransferase